MGIGHKEKHTTIFKNLLYLKPIFLKSQEMLPAILNKLNLCEYLNVLAK
jgi:hypothetical protein